MTDSENLKQSIDLLSAQIADWRRDVDRRLVQNDVDIRRTFEMISALSNSVAGITVSVTDLKNTVSNQSNVFDRIARMEEKIDRLVEDERQRRAASQSSHGIQPFGSAVGGASGAASAVLLYYLLRPFFGH